MSSLILKEIVKALKKQFGGKDKDKKAEGEKKVEGRKVPKPPYPDLSLTIFSKNLRSPSCPMRPPCHQDGPRI